MVDNIPIKVENHIEIRITIAEEKEHEEKFVAAVKGTCKVT